MLELPARVHAIFVTFNPFLDRLALALQALQSQVHTVTIVDNGSTDRVVDWLREKQLRGQCELLALGENYGMATALNRGIERALAEGATHALLMDQDSVAAAGMVGALLRSERELTERGVRVAAVGPCFRDSSYSLPAPFIRVRWLRVERIRCTGEQEDIAVTYLITSGSLIRAEVLRCVGLMDERLFIDYIDVEWGLRANTTGYVSYGCCAAVLAHQLGDRVHRFLGRDIPVRTALRHYYLLRNAFLLYRRSYIPTYWKLTDGVRLPLKFVYYSLFAKPRANQVRMMLTGLLHGLLNRGGRYPDALQTSDAQLHRLSQQRPTLE